MNLNKLQPASSDETYKVDLISFMVNRMSILKCGLGIILHQFTTFINDIFFWPKFINDIMYNIPYHVYKYIRTKSQVFELPLFFVAPVVSLLIVTFL